MTIHYFEKLFNPKSIAIIGASDRLNSVGTKVFSNLLKGNYTGKLYPVNPKHSQVQNHQCYFSVKNITNSIDLVIITTPSNTVPGVLIQCGEKNIPNALIISAGFSETGKEGKQKEQSILDIAKQFNIRIIGPNCLGFTRPSINLHATFDNNIALPGNIALVSQSGAICAAILDWAIDKKIGFSFLVSLGNSMDIGFGEVLDYLANDKETQAILLYIEGIHHSQHFMNSLRSTTKIKPVVVIKGGRFSQGSRAALSHTGALIGDDDVFDAALRQAGAIRVMTIKQLFSAAKILSSNYRAQGNRLTIITNGGGAGVMAADRASELNIILPKLNEKTIAELNEALPSHWSHQNPIDLIGDATPKRYHIAIETCLKNEDSDGLLTMLVPVAMSDPEKVAAQIIADSKNTKKPILACWMGQKQIKIAQDIFNSHHIPHFNTPEEAVEAFSYLANYYLNQKMLTQIEHVSGPLEPVPDISQANNIIKKAKNENRKILTAVESKLILNLFYIPVTLPIEVETADEAVAKSKSIGFPMVMKINSSKITHKQDVGGVKLNIKNKKEIIIAFNNISNNLKKFRPEVPMTGVTIEKMYKSTNDRELMVGVKKDIVFGHAIIFGAGGTLVEIMQDRAIALPPLNSFLCKKLISRTKISKSLDNFRHMPPVKLNQVINVLLRVSQMIHYLPIIQEIDINPLIANENEVIAVDGRIIIN